MSRRFPLLLFAAFVLSSPARADVIVENMRVWRAPDHTRVVFDLSGPLQYRLFTLKAPERIVVDMRDARLRGEVPTIERAGRFLKRVRSGRPEPKTLRIVLDLRRRARARTFVLTPNKIYGHRLVIDLYAPDERPKITAKAPTRRPAEVVVAIDPGHGGEDFGAIGRRGTAEKQVVLGIARYLDRYLDAAPGIRGALIRDGDYYISLRRRVAKARRLGADLFVSIHADSFRHASARGASVYALSQRGATSTQAQILADKENAADLFGGVSLADKDDLLAKVLLDLSMTQTIRDSLEFGADVLRELGRIGPVHIPRVEQAGFAVLKSPDVPSILVEAAFISNPREERLLRTRAHQRRVARAIFRGIQRYLARGKIKKMSAPRRHVVQAGETLSHIAQRYHVTLAALRRANGIEGSKLRVGEVLHIPAPRGP